MANKKYFLVGIGGVGMQGLARLLHANGAIVSGSDMNEFDAKYELEQLGIKVFIGQDRSHITSEIDEVIRSAAVPDTNPEIAKAFELGLPVRRRLELVGELMQKKIGIAIAGTHGKTTTTKLILMMLNSAGVSPTALIGAEVKSLKSNVMIGRGEMIVAEACEYQRSFLDLRPKVLVITNIEADHLDCYKDLDDIKQTFGKLVDLVPVDGGVIIANGDDANVREVLSTRPHKVIWVGFGEGNEIQPHDLEFREGRMYFSINGSRLHLHVPGKHNVFNASLAWAAARYLGVDEPTLKHVLEDEFQGLERRFEIFGTTKGVTFVDDYAHHPTEIMAMLEGAKQYFAGRRLLVVFHPHQFSRTRLLLNDFAKSFSDADLVVVAPIYSVRDTAEDEKSISSEILVDEINKVSGNAKFVGDFEAINQFMMGIVQPGDVVITMGAGKANVFGRELLAALREKR